MLVGPAVESRWEASEGRACPPKCEEKRQSAKHEGGSNSVVESQPSKLLVAGSIPVSRSNLRPSLLTMRRATAGKPSRPSPPAMRRATRGPRYEEAARRPVGRSATCGSWSAKADVAQLAERVLGKDEVTGSIPVIGSR